MITSSPPGSPDSSVDVSTIMAEALVGGNQPKAESVETQAIVKETSREAVRAKLAQLGITMVNPNTSETTFTGEKPVLVADARLEKWFGEVSNNTDRWKHIIYSDLPQHTYDLNEAYKDGEYENEEGEYKLDRDVYSEIRDSVGMITRYVAYYPALNTDPILIKRLVAYAEKLGYEGPDFSNRTVVDGVFLMLEEARADRNTTKKVGEKFYEILKYNLRHEIDGRLVELYGSDILDYNL